jgi:predicted DNA-binding WGR domain protein
VTKARKNGSRQRQLLRKIAADIEPPARHAIITETPGGTPMSSTPVEVVFSFDTTGSMYPCLTQVRRHVKSTVTRLGEEVPGIRIGIIAHGDYCDQRSTYVTRHLPLTSDVDAICRFVETVGPTGGGDAPECYELVLHEAQSQPWTAEATKALVLIGDDVPHPPAHNPGRLDWRQEAVALTKSGVAVYAVQALNRSHAKKFYEELARISGGFHVPLDQFSYVTDMVLAVCYRQSGEEQLQRYEEEVKTQGRMSRGLDKMFSTMLGRAATTSYATADLRAVPPGRFQVLEVDKETPIKAFVEENGLTFKKGRGFYEFTKTETVQGYKEIILMDRATGDFFAGDKAREMLGLPIGENARIRPTDLETYAVFVQSTSVNRVLMGHTRFLYEVEDFDRAGGEEASPTATAPTAPATAPTPSAAPAAAPTAKAAPVAAATKKSPAPAAAPAPKTAVPAASSVPPAPGAASAGRRHFEFVEGKSSKFWEVWVEGTSMYTQYGRIGSAGQTTVKSYGDEAAARKAADKLIAEKTGKGYMEKK